MTDEQPQYYSADNPLVDRLGRMPKAHGCAALAYFMMSGIVIANVLAIAVEDYQDAYVTPLWVTMVDVISALFFVVPVVLVPVLPGIMAAMTVLLVTTEVRRQDYELLTTTTLYDEQIAGGYFRVALRRTLPLFGGMIAVFVGYAQSIFGNVVFYQMDNDRSLILLVLIPFMLFILIGLRSRKHWEPLVWWGLLIHIMILVGLLVIYEIISEYGSTDFTDSSQQRALLLGLGGFLIYGLNMAGWMLLGLALGVWFSLWLRHIGGALVAALVGVYLVPIAFWMLVINVAQEMTEPGWLLLPALLLHGVLFGLLAYGVMLFSQRFVRLYRE